MSDPIREGSAERTPADRWVEVREPQSRRLLFRYDPDRSEVEIKVRGVTTVVELERYIDRG